MTLPREGDSHPPPIRATYLGVSITKAKGWRSFTTAALGRLSRGGIEEINAGFGGTGSLMGVYRLGDADRLPALELGGG